MRGLLTQYTQVGAALSNTLLSGGTERTLVLKLVDTKLFLVRLASFKILPNNHSLYHSPIRKSGLQMSLKFQVSFINEDSNEKRELRTNPWLVG